MYTELMVVGGLFWSLTYILIIRRGFKDKTFGMPLAALCANISWEAIFSLIYPPSPPQIYINYAWFTLDIVIVFQFLRFGKSEFPKFSIKKFYLAFSMMLLIAFGLIFAITYELHDFLGVYAAFGQNLVMSILFVTMLLSRNGVRGQSMYIALFKMLGTGVVSLAFYSYQPISQESVLLPSLYVSIFVVDAIYLILLYRKSKESKISPWLRP
jgi:hypothetical protein